MFIQKLQNPEYARLSRLSTNLSFITKIKILKLALYSIFYR